MPCYDADGNVITCPDKEGKNIESVVTDEGVEYTQTDVDPGGEKPSNLPTPEDTYKNVDKDKFPTLDSYKDYVAQYNLDKYGDQTTTKTWIEKNDKTPKTDIIIPPTEKTYNKPNNQFNDFVNKGLIHRDRKYAADYSDRINTGSHRGTLGLGTLEKQKVVDVQSLGRTGNVDPGENLSAYQGGFDVLGNQEIEDE